MIVNGRLRIDLTNACNGSCGFCPYHGTGVKQSERDFINWSILYDFIKQAAQSSFVQTRFPGSGEPSLHPSFSEILTSCKNMGFETKLFTNGSCLSNQIDTIIDSVDFISISIHSLGINHDRIIGIKGLFKKNLQNIEKLMIKGYSPARIRINAVLTPETVLSLDKLAELCKSMKIKLRIQHLECMSLENRYIFNIEKIIERVDHLKSNFSDIISFDPPLSDEEIKNHYNFNHFFFRNRSTCDNLYNELRIDYLGEVRLCNGCSIGNIKEGLLTILDSSARKNFIEQVNKKISIGSYPEFCSRCCYE